MGELSWCYPCAKFGDFSFSRFGFIVLIDRQTELQTRMIAILTRLPSAWVKISQFKYFSFRRYRRALCIYKGWRVSAPASSWRIRRSVSPHGRRRTAAGQSQRAAAYVGLQLQRIRSHQVDEVCRRGMAPTQAFHLSRVVASLQFYSHNGLSCVNGEERTHRICWMWLLVQRPCCPEYSVPANFQLAV